MNGIVNNNSNNGDNNSDAQDETTIQEKGDPTMKEPDNANAKKVKQRGNKDVK